MTDEEITKRIRKALKEPQWAPEAVQDVSYKDGEVILEGAFVTRWTLSQEDLLALANGIDGCIDAMKAMIKDLQEESAAFQRGVEEGRQQVYAEEKARAIAELASLKDLWAQHSRFGPLEKRINELAAKERRTFRAHAAEQDLG